MKKYIIIGVVIAFAVALLIASNQFKSSDLQNTINTEGEIIAPTDEPLAVTLDFFNAWLIAEQSTSTNPVAENLLALPIISDTLRTSLQVALGNTDNASNPVLCQTETPPRIGGKLSYILGNQAEVHVLARGLSERSNRMSVVTLTGIEGKWVMSDITCSQGETAPEREFSFDREGFLLKNVPPPLNAEFWHLVFEEKGIMGHTAPLFFGPDTTCIATDGTSGICDPTTFTEPSKAHVQGQMSEAGVDVVRVTALP